MNLLYLLSDFPMDLFYRFYFLVNNEGNTIMSRNKQRTYGRDVNQIDNGPVELPKDEIVENETTDETTEVDTPKEESQEVVMPVAEETILSDNGFSPLRTDEEKEALATTNLLTESEVMANVSVTAKMSIQGILQYVKTMKQMGGHVLTLMSDSSYVTNEGPALQVGLFRNLMDIITKTDEVSFRYSMDFVLQLFTQEPEWLGLNNLMRFQENIRLSPVELKCYPNLMVLLTTLCDPVTRKRNARNMIDMRKALEFGFSEAAKTRLISYFEV